MNLGFIFDTRFKKYNNEYYSTNLSSELLTDRYLAFFDEMVVVGRSCPTTESPDGKYLKVTGEKISFKGISGESTLKRVLNFRMDNKYIESVINDCDAVICRGWRGVSACRKLKKPYLVEVVNCAWDSYWNQGLLGKFVAPIIYYKRKKTTKNAPYVLYVTNEFLQKRYPTRGKSVAVSDVALKAFDDSVIDARIKKIEEKTKSEKIVIGTAAAIDVAFKGQRFVIKALAKLKAKGITNIEYQIAGKGNPEKLKKLAEKLKVSDQIVFTGSIVHEKMFDWYDSLDMYIQPSLQEGLPRALIEAMSRGLLCYGTRTGGIPELLGKDFVTKNNRFLSRRLATFISAYDEDIAVQQAKRNYTESRKYDADLLEKRRREFFRDFANDVLGGKNA